MDIPASLQQNLQNLAVLAQKGHAISGRGVLVVAYRGQNVVELHYIPIAYLDDFLKGMPMLEVAQEPLAAYDPNHEFVFLALDLEHQIPGCYIVDLDEA